MAKTNDESEHDLSLDIADAVGKTIGNIVNRIEALDTEKGQLLQKLRDARESLNSQFNKYLPDSIMSGAAAVKSKVQGKRERKPGAACSICGFATNPPHDGRLKAHRDQGEKKKPLTDSQLEASNLTRV
jgi:hypothetical protein